MKRLLSSPGGPEIGLLQSRLEETGIPCVLLDEQMAQAIHSAAFPAELWITHDADYRRAVDLCEAWQVPSSEPLQPWTCPECSEVLAGEFTHCWKCGIERGLPLGHLR